MERAKTTERGFVRKPSKPQLARVGDNNLLKPGHLAHSTLHKDPIPKTIGGRRRRPLSFSHTVTPCSIRSLLSFHIRLIILLQELLTGFHIKNVT
ncbi:hypothetical protein Nepgr_013982 [Nepenthes gracilis]|uniref:Uncharacterized protein n=1 Tax=Nepenthes gracilis TaxID=150966 RepID=A0AAD3SK58_NEPGR|nr:hypothetical protein Nepgr_013982 [Nepenthes gracilis]